MVIKKKVPKRKKCKKAKWLSEEALLCKLRKEEKTTRLEDGNCLFFMELEELCNSVAKKKRKEKKSSIFFWMHAADSEEQHIAAYSSETVDSKNS